jgi:glucokinase
LILAGDIGATKILLEVGELRSEGWVAAQARRYGTSDAEDFGAILTAFLGEWNRHRPRDQRISAAAFGVAGPVEGNRVKMTHRPWVVDGDKFASRFLIPKVRVVNDLVATAHGIPWLGSRDIVTIQAGKPSPTDPRVVLGVGTGLGVAYMVPTGKGGYREVASEGGHVGFAPATVPQAELWNSIFASHGRVAAEDVASGAGLKHLYAFAHGPGAHEPGAAEDQITAEWITRTALDKSDPASAAALDLFFECLGNVAGDHALSVLARGGVYLAGGVIARVVNLIPESRFLKSFTAKSPLDALLMKIPVYAISTERAGVLGAAKLASEL